MRRVRAGAAATRRGAANLQRETLLGLRGCGGGAASLGQFREKFLHPVAFASAPQQAIDGAHALEVLSRLQMNPSLPRVRALAGAYHDGSQPAFAVSGQLLVPLAHARQAAAANPSLGFGPGGRHPFIHKRQRVLKAGAAVTPAVLGVGGRSFRQRRPVSSQRARV